MKRILFLMLLIVPFFMGMKVVYYNETGKIKAMGPFVNYQTQDGEAVMEVKSADPKDINDFIVDKGVYRKKNASEISADVTEKETEKTAKKNRKAAVLAKLKLEKADIKGLTELIQDGNDE